MTAATYYTRAVRILTVRLPDALVEDIEAEAAERRRSRSDVVRDRLTRAAGSRAGPTTPAIGDLVGSVDRLPADLSGRKKAYLRVTRYGRKPAR
jgi:Arc/MetJ-type ribon-helix-helix transcriptional regulator